MEPRIVSFEALGSGRLRLGYEHGVVADVDLQPLIQQGGVFQRFADDNYLAAAVIVDYGYGLEWPDEVDLSAANLWERRVSVRKRAPVPA